MIVASQPEVFYPSSDGEPLAETSLHIDAIIAVVTALRLYLQQRQQAESAIVLTNQFLYYAQGWPRLRVAPDVMVIFGVAPGPRDNFKIWEEGQVPAVIFEITSAATQDQDQGFKKGLYQQLGVQEYWQFDPKGEWIAEKLRGYQLAHGEYVLIPDCCSQILQLRLSVEAQLLSFYRLDTDEKLPILEDMALALQQAVSQAEAEQQRAEQERLRAERLAEKLRELGFNPDQI